jgi:hypothetical protein
MLRSRMRTKSHPIVCKEQRSENLGYVCVKGFNRFHERRGIERYCASCLNDVRGPTESSF